MDPWLDHFARANFERSADTAHDLKTPLNVAVLNLELLRMRLRKVASEEDPKIAAYTQAIESELRRLGKIFDAFFLLSTPPKNEDLPVPIDVLPICTDAAAEAGFTLAGGESASVVTHEARIRQALKLFFEGAAKIFATREAAAAREDGQFVVTITGRPAIEDFDLAKVFKFYYTDDAGNPDLSLALARLITETYGGEIDAALDRDKVLLRLSFPLGAE